MNDANNFVTNFVHIIIIIMWHYCKSLTTQSAFHLFTSLYGFKKQPEEINEDSQLLYEIHRSQLLDLQFTQFYHYNSVISVYDTYLSYLA